MKILILPDGLNWIVDRNCRALVKHLPDIEFFIHSYMDITEDEFVEASNNYDLIHYFNWDIGHLYNGLTRIKKPLIITCRSHRYTEYIKKMYDDGYQVHVINPLLLKDFPNATYIPNGIFDQFRPDHEFTVGFAGRPEYHRWEYMDDYKGVGIITEACNQLGIKFKPAFGDIDPEEMPEYYRSIDLYICASKAEGFSTPVMECLAMNKPVLSVDVGLPSLLNIHKCERTVDGIKNGILKFYTRPQVEEYTWENIAPKYRKMYEEAVNKK